MLFFDWIASSFGPRHAALLPAVVFAGAIGCGGVVVDRDSHTSGDSTGDGGAGGGGAGGTTGAGGGLACPAGAWGRGFADAYKFEYGEGVAVGADCTIVVSGSFGGVMDLGGLSISGQDEDVFVAKFDPSGKPLWGKRFGDEPFQGSAFTAVDASGDAAVAGTFNGTMAVGSTTLVEKKNGMFVFALDPDGEPLWGRSFGSDAEQVLTRVAFDPQGAVLISGYGSGGLVDLGQGPIGTPGASIAFVARLNAKGATEWSAAFDGFGVRATSVAADAKGNVWVTGSFQVKLQVGSFLLEGVGGAIPFFAKLDASGEVLQAFAIPGQGSRTATSVAITGDGGALIAGGFDNTVDLGDGPETVNGSYDGFLLSVDPSGEPRWGVTFGGPSVDAVTGVATAPDGGAWITGGFSGSIDFGATHLESAGPTDAFVARVDEGGQFTYARSFGGPSGGGDNGNAIAVDPDGNALVTGTFMETADLGSGPVTSAGLLDVFLAKVAP